MKATVENNISSEQTSSNASPNPLAKYWKLGVSILLAIVEAWLLYFYAIPIFIFVGIMAVLVLLNIELIMRSLKKNVKIKIEKVER